MIYGDSNITLEINDHFRLEDGISLANKMNKPWLRGHLVFRDPVTNEIILEKDNLILLRSRAYVLELLFGMTVNKNETGYITSHDRKVSLFQIGSGGADIVSSPMEVVAPKFNNVELYNEIPFIIEDPNKNIDPQKLANPSYVRTMTDKQKKTYYLPKENPDGSIAYYGKVFEENSSRLVVNTTTNQCYVTFNLRISKEDARGLVINELGLVLCKYKQSTNEYIENELFSHVSFESISLKSLKRGILCSYSIYA